LTGGEIGGGDVIPEPVTTDNAFVRLRAYNRGISWKKENYNLAKNSEVSKKVAEV